MKSTYNVQGNAQGPRVCGSKTLRSSHFLRLCGKALQEADCWMAGAWAMRLAKMMWSGHFKNDQLIGSLIIYTDTRKG